MEYADRRESRRLQSSWLFLGFVAALGAASALRFNGTVLWLILAFLGAVFLAFLVLLVRRPDPSALTPVTDRHQAGTWAASVPAFLFPEVRDAHPKMNEYAEFAGTVSLDPAGVTWKPNERTQRGFGVAELVWDTSWRLSARRLPGLGSQVQLNLQNPKTGETVTIWMRGAGAFRIT